MSYYIRAIFVDGARDQQRCNYDVKYAYVGEIGVVTDLEYAARFFEKAYAAEVVDRLYKFYRCPMVLEILSDDVPVGEIKRCTIATDDWKFWDDDSD